MFQGFAGGESFGSACAFNDDLIPLTVISVFAGLTLPLYEL